MPRRQAGFTLLELMIVVAVLGILAAIAVPQYSLYTQRASYLNITEQAYTAKTALEQCIQRHNDISLCDSDAELAMYGFNKAKIESLAYIDSATVTPNGNSVLITITPADSPASMSFLSTALDYVAAPIVSTNGGGDIRITNWTVHSSAGCLSAGVCN